MTFWVNMDGAAIPGFIYLLVNEINFLNETNLEKKYLKIWNTEIIRKKESLVSYNNNTLLISFLYRA